MKNILTFCKKNKIISLFGLIILISLILLLIFIIFNKNDNIINYLEFTISLLFAIFVFIISINWQKKSEKIQKYQNEIIENCTKLIKKQEKAIKDLRNIIDEKLIKEIEKISNISDNKSKEYYKENHRNLNEEENTSEIKNKILNKN